MAGPWEDFQSEPTTRITVRPQDAQRGPWDEFSSQGDVSVEGLAKAGGIGLAKGAIGIAGMGGDAWSLIDAGLEKAGLSKEQRELAKRVITKSPAFGPLLGGPSSQQVQGKIEEYTGEFRKPQNKAERYTQTAAEFVPGALAPMGGGGWVSRLIKFGLLPGAASEAAGQAVEGSKAEPYVRAAAAVATGGAASMLTRPKTTATTIRGAIPDNVTPAQLDAAEQLFQEAAQAGMPITRAEAVQYVTAGATRLGDVQRVVEGQGGLKQFFAQRAQQTEEGFTDAARNLDPTPTPQPSTIGPAVGQAAEGTVNDVRGAINAASEPFYTAAATQRIPPAEMGRLRNAPGWREARDAVRNDPQLARYVQGLPDNSVGFVNEVKKYLDTAAENAAGAMNAQRNQQRAAGYGSDAALARQTAIDASQEYEIALQIQQQARERFLGPLLAGPIGKLAKNDLTTKQAIDALFPNNPLPNSANEITTAVSALVQRNPTVARQLVRAHVESVFNEATQNLASGPNQFGGAKFAAVIRGNPQQAANLEAAIRALPNGDRVYAGFDRFLQMLEAQGTRQPIGSQTAFNQEVLQDLRRGTAVQEAGTAVLSGGIKLPAKIKDTIDRWRLGRGVEEIGRLLTDREAGVRFAQIAQMPTGSRDALHIFGRLVLLAHQGARSGEKINQPAQGYGR